MPNDKGSYNGNMLKMEIASKIKDQPTEQGPSFPTTLHCFIAGAFDRVLHPALLLVFLVDY